MRLDRFVPLVVLAPCLAVACAAPPPVAAPAGQPLPGLTPAERARFDAGRDAFLHVYTPAEGLGPLFNETRCANCHDLPTPGGTGVELVTKANRFANNVCDPLTAAGGDNVQHHSTALLARARINGEHVPDGATAVTILVPPTLYGLGLLEAVPDSAIDQKGATGHVARTADGRIGRFGRKAEFATIREFVEGALLEEIGITSPNRPEELKPNGRPLPKGTDPAPDPEANAATVDALTDFVRFLAPPAPESLSTGARDSIAAGERVFAQAGCASCHTPVLTTAASPSQALGARRVAAYTDLRVHDLGPDVAGICGQNAGPAEWRTTPLMGIRGRQLLMHDGQSQSIDAAIRRHGGEAARSRDSYGLLDPASRAALLRFVRTR